MTPCRAVLSTLLVAMSLLASYPAEAPASNLPKVKVHLSWFANPGHAPVLVAEAKGFYKAAGVELTWSPGNGSFEAVQVVGSGAAQFGIADATTMAKGIAEGIPVMAVAMFFQTTPAAIIARPDIKAPKDLEGKKLATVSTTSTHKLLPAFAKATHIDLNKIEVIAASVSTQKPMFLSGQVDALDGYANGEWIEVLGAGKKASLLRWSDYGFNMYGNTLIVNKSYAAANPGVVRKVVQATIKGLEYALAHPQETVAIVKRSSALSVAVLSAQWKETATLMKNQDTTKFGLGWMTSEGWRNLQALNRQYGGQTREIPLEQLFTTAFLK